MSFKGSITITDTIGNAVFERELSPEEIISTLVHELRRPVAGGATYVSQKDRPRTCCGVPMKQPHLVSCENAPVKTGARAPRVERDEDGAMKCCGSLGTRHTAVCRGKESRVIEPKKHRNVSVRETKPCCGSKGVRHKNGCPTLTGQRAPSMAEFDVVDVALEDAPAPEESRQEPSIRWAPAFDEDTWRDVKQARLDGKDAAAITSEFELNLEQINDLERAMNAPAYSVYVSIATRAREAVA